MPTPRRACLAALGALILAAPTRAWADLDLTLPRSRRDRALPDSSDGSDLVPTPGDRPAPPATPQVEHLPGGGVRVRRDGVFVERRPGEIWRGEESGERVGFGIRVGN